MCGIFGAVIGETRALRDGQRLLERLFLLSESRGKEAAGLALADSDTLTVYRAPVAASRLVRDPIYRRLAADSFTGERRHLAFVGHSRLVTDGERAINRNNQPVIAGGMVGVHNGIVVNDDELWSAHPELERRCELDSEVIFALLGHHLAGGRSLSRATERTFAAIEGAASIAALFADSDLLLVATNNGSLYYRSCPGRIFVFASERYIVDEAAAAIDEIAGSRSLKIRPGEAAAVDLAAISVELVGADRPMALPARPPRRVIDCSRPDTGRPPQRRSIDPEALLERFPYVSMRDRLRRCSRCVLPETMPFVDFDGDGVCAYCRNYPPIEVHGRAALDAMVAQHRRGDGAPDCVVGVSGGRDSMYGLHYIKTELGLEPVAYTYDWGMVTDLARRNVSRICGKLGIEHVLVSADIPTKREYIRKNVEAWLARPALTTVPLLMAGDKAYFHHLNKTRERVGVELGFLCENLLERTDFKTGFAGVPPFFDENHVYTLPVRSKIAYATAFAKEVARNPRYLNSSLIDTARAFAYYYLIERRYTNLYRYIQWDEATVNSTLIDEYNFELAEDTGNTWRIGDGTAAFYNYIYYAIAGMTENDTFRSNQIRAGAMGRDEALERIDRDNRPRFPSIQWYLDTIGLGRSIDEVLTIINGAPKLY